MKTFTVAHCSEYFGYITGGVETNVRNVCEGLSARGYQVELITSQTPWRPAQIALQNVPIHYSLGLFDIRERAHLFQSPLTDFFFYFPEWVYRKSVAKHLHGAYDLLHVHSLNALLAAVEHRVVRPIAVTLYMPVPPRYHCILNRADSIIARSSPVARQVETILGRPCAYIPPSYDSACFHPRDHRGARQQLMLDQESQILLFVGRLTPIKNLEILLEALKKMACQLSKVHLVVIGRGMLRDRLEQQCVRLDILSRVHFVDHEPPERLALYYNAADLVVVPSLYESFSLVALEALVSGSRLLISSGLEEFHRLFPEVNVFDCQNAEDLCRQALHTLTAPPTEFTSDRFLPYQWQSALDQHEMLYQRLIDNVSTQ